MTDDATPGLMIAAPRSGSGKTTLMLGLLRALSRAGVTVGSAKCGPDYIDGNFHRAAGACDSVNLDSWAMSPGLIAELAARAGAGKDLVLCEALMGLFDGVPAPAGRTGSSADVAAALGWPLLLVLDASGQSQTAAALVKGCATYDPRVEVRGVVLNRVGSPRHASLASAAIEALGIPVFGALPRSSEVVLPERHLGLVQVGETSELGRILDRLADFIEAHVDVSAVRSSASPGRASSDTVSRTKPPGQRIAAAQDTAFSFLYPHLLDAWRAQGAEIRFFSPLADEAPDEDCDVAWLPGGYPELHAGKLAASYRFLDGVRRFAETRPVHGECGGYMVLGSTLTDADGRIHPMTGLLDLATTFAQRKLHLGYREARLLEASCLGPAGTVLRGHEFHYATIQSTGSDAPLLIMEDAYGGHRVLSGSRRGNVSGSFFHLIAAAA
jgi:cobyrinic acid a,c-diamide synthase